MSGLLLVDEGFCLSAMLHIFRKRSTMFDPNITFNMKSEIEIKRIGFFYLKKLLCKLYFCRILAG